VCACVCVCVRVHARAFVRACEYRRSKNGRRGQHWLHYSLYQARALNHFVKLKALLFLWQVMHVCITYVIMCVRFTDLCVYVCVYISAYVSQFVSVCACGWVHVSMYLCACVHVFMCICVHTCVSVFMCVQLLLCVHVYQSSSTFMNVYERTHKHSNNELYHSTQLQAYAQTFTHLHSVTQLCYSVSRFVF